VKFPWGKQIARRFNKNDPVKDIYAFAQSVVRENAGAGGADAGQNFDLFTAFPPTSLMPFLDMSLVDAGVTGNQLIMRWT
jgi:UBX domain